MDPTDCVPHFLTALPMLLCLGAACHGRMIATTPVRPRRLRGTARPFPSYRQSPSESAQEVNLADRGQEGRELPPVRAARSPIRSGPSGISAKGAYLYDSDKATKLWGVATTTNVTCDSWAADTAKYWPLPSGSTTPFTTRCPPPTVPS